VAAPAANEIIRSSAELFGPVDLLGQLCRSEPDPRAPLNRAVLAARLKRQPVHPAFLRINNQQLVDRLAA
jgi:hypothetical protein